MADAFDEGLKAGGYDGPQGEAPGLTLPDGMHGMVIGQGVAVVVLFEANRATITEGPVLHHLRHHDPDARAAVVLRISRVLPEHLRALADRVEAEGVGDL